ncbi:hypothetical protein V8F33_013859 [Rhypophila sp. PSN 637]
MRMSAGTIMAAIFIGSALAGVIVFVLMRRQMKRQGKKKVDEKENREGHTITSGETNDDGQDHLLELPTPRPCVEIASSEMPTSAEPHNHEHSKTRTTSAVLHDHEQSDSLCRSLAWELEGSSTEGRTDSHQGRNYARQ